MSEKKYYVKLSPEVMYYSDYGLGSIQYLEPYLNDSGDFAPAIDRTSFTKSELAEIMDGVLYRTFNHQFHPQLAEELYKLGYRTTQTTEEWIEARYEFDNIWEWINPLIELVPVEDGE